MTCRCGGAYTLTWTIVCRENDGDWLRMTYGQAAKLDDIVRHTPDD